MHHWLYIFVWYPFPLKKKKKPRGNAVSVVVVCHPSLVWYPSECSGSTGQALRCICSNNPLLWWLITCSVGNRHVSRRMGCFSNHLFFFSFLWLTRRHAGEMNSWPTCPGKKQQHILKQSKYTSLPDKPQTSVSFRPAKQRKHSQNTFLFNILCTFSFFKFCFRIYNTAIIFLVTVWAEYWKAIG